ncbi:MAG: transglutaminase family protein [bacterium]
MNDKQTDISALMTLLGDEDQEVVQSVRNRIMEMGAPILPELKEQYEKQPLPVKLKMKDIMARLKPVCLENDFRALFSGTKDENLDLQEALFTVSRIGYPHLDKEIYIEKLEEIISRVESKLQRWETVDDHTAVEAVNEVLFEEYDFQGNESNFYDPDNSFFNRVLQRKMGSPLLLSCLILLIARRLDLPYQPVAMPAHCIVAYSGKKRRIFIDPFHSGQLLTRDDCIEFLNSAGFGFVEEYLAPVSDRKLLSRVLKNLLNSYHRSHNNSRIEELRGYLAIVERFC